MTVTFVLLKIAPNYPPARPEDKIVWLEKRAEEGNFISEYYNEDIPGDVAEVNRIRNEHRDEIDSDVFIVYPPSGSNSPRISVFYRVPVINQLWNWAREVILHWNWGESTALRINYPAFKIILDPMPLTFSINIVTLLFYVPFGFLFGILAALKKDTWVDNLMQIIIMIFLSVPGLVLILTLQIFFGYAYPGILPGRFPDLLLQADQVWMGYFIPMIAGGLPAIASITRFLRAELSEVLTSDFVMLAKTKGLSHGQAVVRHAIRNSMVPLMPLIIYSFAGLLGGSFILESVYGIPGVGLNTLQAAQLEDYNVIMVSTAFYGIIGLTAALLVDLSYGLVDPRIRIGGTK